MTERQWRACADPYRMAEFLDGAASRRKTALLACAALRLDPAFLSDPEARGVIEDAERLADGFGVAPNRIAAFDRLVGQPEHREFDRLGYLRPDDRLGQDDIVLVVHGHLDPGYVPELVGSDLLRCLFGVPFARQRLSTAVGHAMQVFFGSRPPGRRPVLPAVGADPAWLTPAVLAIAGGVYADHAFDRLPVLADALEDAGCRHADLLAHCRGGGPHARGGWVVDLLLGRPRQVTDGVAQCDVTRVRETASRCVGPRSCPAAPFRGVGRGGGVPIPAAPRQSPPAPDPAPSVGPVSGGVAPSTP